MSAAAWWWRWWMASGRHGPLRGLSFGAPNGLGAGRARLFEIESSATSRPSHHLPASSDSIIRPIHSSSSLTYTPCWPVGVSRRRLRLGASRDANNTPSSSSGDKRRRRCGEAPIRHSGTVTDPDTCREYGGRMPLPPKRTRWPNSREPKGAMYDNIRWL